MTKMVHNYLVYVVWVLVPIFKWFQMKMVSGEYKNISYTC